MARRRAVALALFAALLPSHAPAEALQRLTVTSFTLSASTTHPQMETPFDLIVRLHVRERLDGIDNLNLPMLSDLEVIGDERRYSADANGTNYVEDVRVVAHHGGHIDVSPATLDAIDALDGKPKRYSTNALHLEVSGPAVTSGAVESDVTSAMWSVLRALLVAAAILFAVVALVVVLIVRAARRRPQSVPALPPLPVAQTVATPTMRDVVDAAAADLAADRTRSGAVRARARVRAFVGAGERETLTDVLRRPGVTPQFGALLRALERAAFTYETDVDAAIDHALETMRQL